jgi:hypothetical protein
MIAKAFGTHTPQVQKVCNSGECRKTCACGLSGWDVEPAQCSIEPVIAGLMFHRAGGPARRGGHGRESAEERGADVARGAGRAVSALVRGGVPLGPALPLQPLGRLEFYATCREPDLAVCVATGDDRLYANILLTVGYIPPSP